MYIDETDKEARDKIGLILINMKAEYEAIREFLFLINEDGYSTAERIEGGSELFAVFNMWIKGEEISMISEAIFQDDEEPVKRILASVGI